MYLSEIGVGEASSFRGRYPGAFYCPQNIGTLIFPQGSTVTDVMQYPGRIFRAVLNNSGPLFFDVTGPWR